MSRSSTAAVQTAPDEPAAPVRPATGCAGAATESHPTTCFSILARAEPGVMPRILELFAKRNLVPARWHSDLVPAETVGLGEQPGLTIDLQVAGLSREEAGFIARTLRQLFDVETVLTSEKFTA